MVGNLGQDPELRHTAAGTAVCNLRLATNESYKDKDGEWVERVEWHSIVIWGKLAEIVNEFSKKGTMIYIEGSLQTSKYVNKDGNDVWTTKIVAKEAVIMSGRRSSSNGEAGAERHDQPAQDESVDKETGEVTSDKTYTFEPDDELPF